ncbi:MAG: heavy metal-binding domain-containing protein [Isosphaeraceae bacterium]
MISLQTPASPQGRASPPSVRSLRQSIRAALRLVEVRLRIPLFLIVSAVVVGRWDTLRNYWDRLFHVAREQSSATSPVSTDTEYFCPMDPGVVSSWPGKCGICNMDLVRRKRGEAAALPGGVVARMQLSPYRVQLAGIETAPVRYEPLARSFRAAGIVRREGNSLVVPLEIPPRHLSWLKGCTEITAQCGDANPARPCAGRLHFHDRRTEQGGQGVATMVEILGSANGIEPGVIADVTCHVPVAQLEPFRSLPTDPPPLKPDEPRQLYTCPEHPQNLDIKPGHCSVEGNELMPQPILETQRIRWWCPMHPAVTSDQAGKRCQECGGMILKPRVLSYQPPGKVLAVPESAVVDTGLRKVVFIETMPGMFDGVEVVLGPRCGDSYPVVQGLEPEQKVAVSGAFLLDAETRLNPSLASNYFGAGRTSHSTSASSNITVATSPGDSSPLAQLAPADRILAQQQKICPVTRKALGSMGTPVRVVVADRVVFLCCSGCQDALESNPARYLTVLDAKPAP